MRAGFESIPRARSRPPKCLALSRVQIYWHVILRPAIERVYPALTSQFVLLMLASSITSQISAEELTAVANYVQSDTYRAFETYIVVAVVLHRCCRCVMRAGFWAARPGRCFRAGDASARRCEGDERRLSTSTTCMFLLHGAGWTIGPVADRLRRRRHRRASSSRSRASRRSRSCAGLRRATCSSSRARRCWSSCSWPISACASWASACRRSSPPRISLTIYVSAYLGEIWRGCIQSVPRTQWEAAECLALTPHASGCSR